MKNLTKIASATLLIGAMISPTTQAAFSANVALTTDYVWRGVSQNGEDPAIQGGFDYTSETGFYAGTWGSNVNFSGASTELDLYGGWSKQFENGVGVDFGVIRYVYLGSDAASDNDFTEYYGGASYGGFGFTYSLGDEFGDQFEANYSYNIGSVSVAAAVGNYDVNDDGNDYSYFSLGVSGNFAGPSELGWDLSYYDTDDNDSEQAEGRLVFTISKTF